MPPPPLLLLGVPTSTKIVACLLLRAAGCLAPLLLLLAPPPELAAAAALPPASLLLVRDGRPAAGAPPVLLRLCSPLLRQQLYNGQLLSPGPPSSSSLAVAGPNSVLVGSALWSGWHSAGSMNSRRGAAVVVVLVVLPAAAGLVVARCGASAASALELAATAAAAGAMHGSAGKQCVVKRPVTQRALESQLDMWFGWLSRLLTCVSRLNFVLGVARLEKPSSSLRPVKSRPPCVLQVHP